MKKRVWILNHYAGSMYYSAGGRHYWFAKYLKRGDYEPVVFCANAKHGIREQYVETGALWVTVNDDAINVPFVFVRSSLYGTNGRDRLFSMISFYRNVQKAARQFSKEYGEPDIIIASSVHPLTLVAGLKLAKLFGIKCICEMRDLWPEAIVTYSKRIKRDSLLARVMYAGERWIYTKADSLIFTMPGGVDYIRSRGWDKESGGPIDLNKVYHVNNGVDLDIFDDNSKRYIYVDKDMDETDTFKVVYTGSVRRINNLGLVLDAAKEIVDDRIRIVIFGDGDELMSLRQRIEDEGIINVQLKGRVDKRYIPSIICRSDLNLVHWEMSPLLRFGASFNKAFEYFAAGKPMLSTVKPGYSLIERYECGLVCERQSALEIASSIEKMADEDPRELLRYGVNARGVASHYDFKVLTNALIDIIEHC